MIALAHTRQPAGHMASSEVMHGIVEAPRHYGIRFAPDNRKSKDGDKSRP
jgi:hypothetical protein